ncbi:MAG: flippase activity-associated protein Agl23 [Chloroflexota bacterium]
MDNVEVRRRDLLATPVWRFLVLNWETALFVSILLAGAVIRFAGLGVRSIGHDGSIHASWSHDLYSGQGYRHNPTYHGPFLYHFTALIFFLFGDTDVTMLSSPAIFGVLLIGLPWLLRKELGRIGTLLASAMMVVSPLLVAYSKTLRHDMFLAVWTMLLVVAVFCYLRQRADRWLYLAAAATALALCTKEVAFIEIFIVGSFLFFLLLWEWTTSGERLPTKLASFDLVMVIGTLVAPMGLTPVIVKWRGFDPAGYSDPQNAVPSLIVLLIVIAVTAVAGLMWDHRRWLISATIFYSITLLLFTTFLTNGLGIVSGYVGSLGYWLRQQDVRRGGQPWFYYLIVMPLYEFMPLLLGGMGALWLLIRPQGRRAGEARPEEATRPVSTWLVAFLIYWAVASLLIFSWAGEKMPWLITHLTLPWILLGAWFAGRVLQTVDWRAWWARSGGLAVLLIPLAALGLVTFVRFRPFTDVTLQGLGQTMRWIGALIVLAASGAGLYGVARRLTWRGAAQSLFVVVLAVLYLLTVRVSIMATHININYTTEWIGYAHSTPDTMRVARELEELSRRYAGDLSMPVAYDNESSWPFAWYLRNFTQAHYFVEKPAQPFDEAAVIVGYENEADCRPYLGDAYYRFENRLIWWPQESYKSFAWQSLKYKLPPEELTAINDQERVPLWTYLKLLLTEIREQYQDPAKRAALWDILWHRKFKESTAAWPLVDRFALYVRKDVANQLWDFQAAPAAPETLPQDPYRDLYRALTAIQTWGFQGAADGQFNYPRDVAIDPAGYVYVTDSSNHRIQKFDLQGNHLLTWGSQGNGPGQFQEPWGLVVDDRGRVYVADTWNHRVQVFDGDGTLIAAWGAHAQVQGLDPDTAAFFWGPRDITIDGQGRVLVTDTGNKRVQVFTPEGEFITMFGGFGVEPGQMNEPVGIAVGPDGRIYVADTWNRRVQVFADFTFEAEWPVDGWWGESVVNKPYLAVDGAGRVYATDPEGYRVLVFTANGEPLAVFGQVGAGADAFNLPTGVAVDGQGNIYIADADNHRVVKLAPLLP